MDKKTAQQHSGGGETLQGYRQQPKLPSIKHLLPCTIFPQPQFRLMTEFFFFLILYSGFNVSPLLILSQESDPRGV